MHWWFKEEGTWRRDISALEPCDGDGITPLRLPPIKPLKAQPAERSTRVSKFVKK